MNMIYLALMSHALVILLFLNLDSYVFSGTSRTKRGKGKGCIHLWILGKQLLYVLLLL